MAPGHRQGEACLIFRVYFLSQFLGPIDQDFHLRGIQPRISMHPRVGLQWHGATMDLICDRQKLLGLPMLGIRAEVREIELSLALADMLRKPACSRLDLRIPRIVGSIRVTVVAAGPDQSLHLRTSGMERKQIVRPRRRIVPRGSIELKPRKSHKDHQAHSLCYLLFFTAHKRIKFSGRGIPTHCNHTGGVKAPLRATSQTSKRTHVRFSKSSGTTSSRAPKAVVSRRLTRCR